MGNLKAVVDLGGTNGHEQQRLRQEATRVYARVDVEGPPTDTFPFHDSIISEQTVRERMEAAIERAGLKGRVFVKEISSLRKDVSAVSASAP